MQSEAPNRARRVHFASGRYVHGTSNKYKTFKANHDTRDSTHTPIRITIIGAALIYQFEDAITLTVTSSQRWLCFPSLGQSKRFASPEPPSSMSYGSRLFMPGRDHSQPLSHWVHGSCRSEFKWMENRKGRTGVTDRRELVVTCSKDVDQPASAHLCC